MQRVCSEGVPGPGEWKSQEDITVSVGAQTLISCAGRSPFS